jgi:hypothetical protein
MTAARDIRKTTGGNKRRGSPGRASRLFVFFLIILPLVLAGRVFALGTTIDDTSNNNNPAYSWLIGNSGGGSATGPSSGNTLTVIIGV